MKDNLVEFLDLGGQLAVKKENGKYLLVAEVFIGPKEYHKAIAFNSREHLITLMQGKDVFIAMLKGLKDTLNE